MKYSPVRQVCATFLQASVTRLGSLHTGLSIGMLVRAFSAGTPDSYPEFQLELEGRLSNTGIHLHRCAVVISGGPLKVFFSIVISGCLWGGGAYFSR